MAFLEEPDPVRRMVMLAVAREATGWHEAHVHNGVVSAFNASEKG